MQLDGFPNLNFGDFKEFSVDVDTCYGMAKGMIQGLELSMYIVARERGKDYVDSEMVWSTIRLLDNDVQPDVVEKFTRIGFTTPEIAQEFAKAPIKHDSEAFGIMASYVNYEIFGILQAGAERAAKEGERTIRVRHLLPACEKWPYPWNLLEC